MVAAWVEAADRKRPWRAQIRERIADQVTTLTPGARVLELGAGPGLVAECVLRRCPAVASYTLLDFSMDMLAIGRERLARYPMISVNPVDDTGELLVGGSRDASADPVDRQGADLADLGPRASRQPGCLALQRQREARPGL